MESIPPPICRKSLRRCSSAATYARRSTKFWAGISCVMREVEATARRLQAERNASNTLSFEDIELMVANRVSTPQLIDRINEHGVNFDLTAERRARLKAERTDEAVLETIVKARRKY